MLIEIVVHDKNLEFKVKKYFAYKKIIYTFGVSQIYAKTIVKNTKLWQNYIIKF